MTYNQEYLINLEKVINLIKQDKISESLPIFKNYLDTLYIGRYSVLEWNQGWRRKVYEFGELFKTKDAGSLINTINEYLKTKSLEESEAAQFIYSEIIWNYFPKEESYAADILKGLIKKYPPNPEFHHSYSHFLEDKGNYALSIVESFFAFKIEPENDVFYGTCFNKCKKYFNVLLLKGKTSEAEDIISKMQDITKDRKDPLFNNIIVSLKDRLADHKIINKRIEGIAEIAQRAVEKERGRIIEIMGFFVAILGFVFININLATSSFKFNEILLLMLGMGLMLSFFATLISILFRTNKNIGNFYKDSRFWVLIIFIILFITFICTYSPRPSI